MRGTTRGPATAFHPFILHASDFQMRRFQFDLVGSPWTRNREVKIGQGATAKWPSSVEQEGGLARRKEQSRKNKKGTDVLEV